MYVSTHKCVPIHESTWERKITQSIILSLCCKPFWIFFKVTLKLVGLLHILKFKASFCFLKCYTKVFGTKFQLISVISILPKLISQCWTQMRLLYILIFMISAWAFSSFSLSSMQCCPNTLDIVYHTDIWVTSWRWCCLVTWFCYHLIAKPGNETAAPSCPDSYKGCLCDCYTITWWPCYCSLDSSLFGLPPSSGISPLSSPQPITILWTDGSGIADVLGSGHCHPGLLWLCLPLHIYVWLVSSGQRGTFQRLYADS